MVNQRWFKGVLMITKDNYKGDDKKLKDQSKNNSSDQDRIKNNSRLKRKVKESRIKIQGSRSQESRSRFKTQESREGLIKISMKRFFQKLSSTWNFLKTCLPKSFYSLVIDYQ